MTEQTEKLKTEYKKHFPNLSDTEIDIIINQRHGMNKKEFDKLLNTPIDLP